MKFTTVFLLYSIIFSLSTLNAQPPARTTDNTVISWIKENALPIQRIDPDPYTEDLEPMEQLLKGVRVVGMGELSHGTSECYRFEHRLFEFLVERMGFNAIAIEASTVACEPINDYVLHGRGTLAEVLTGEIYSLWHTEEMTALIKWMRSYNEGVPDARKVQFFGMDLGSNERARKQVRAYVEAHIPQWLAPLDSIFEPMADADPKMPMRMNEFKDQAAVLLPKLQAFSQYLQANEGALIKESSLHDFEKIKRYTRIMEQFLAFHSEYRLRAGFMGENLLYLMEQMPDSKFMVLAHKWHIAAVEELNNLGQQLRKNLGEKYYAFTFESYQGSFLGRTWNPDQKYLGEFKVFELGPAGENTLPWYLAEAQKRNFFLNLRGIDNASTIEEWIKAPKETYTPGWIPQNIADNSFLNSISLDLFDGVLFFERTTASHPTKSALELVPKREGL